jgi:ABC-type transport system substrate-binding protein
VFVRILPEEFTRVAEFEVGRLDVLEIPPAESRRFRERPELAAAVHRQVALVTEYVGLNNEDPVLADPRVRRALNHAVDVELILERVLEGRGVRSTGPVPPSLPGGGSCAPFAHDPERARALLAEAGVPAEWTLRLWQRPSPLASQVLEAVQADLAAVGVRAEIRLRDWGALKAAIDRGEASAFFINWFADYPDPENFLGPLFHSRNVGGGGNRARVRDPALDAALDRLDAEFAPEARADLVRDIEARLREMTPWLYLWHPVLEVAVSERVAGYRPHPVASCERWLDVRPAGSAGRTP